MNKAYDKVTWQNTPSTASPLSASNLNKMSDALDTIDDRVITLDGQASSASSAITALQEGKVDKVAGKGLSTNDYTTTEKTKLADISAQANKVEITPVVTEGTTLATISIDGVDTAIKGSDIEVDDEMSPTSENPVQNKVITAEINKIDENKADKNGEITSAKASYSLLCDTPVNDNVPYTYRQFPATNAKLEKLKKIVGASVVWNQLVQNGNFANTNNWTLSQGSGTTFTVSNNIAHAEFTSDYNYIGQSREIIVNHIYLTFATVRAIQGTLNIRLNESNNIAVSNNNFETYSKVFKASGTSVTLYPLRRSTSDVTVIGECKNVMMFDLTAMFNPTIADYVNTLETQTAGSGIAWLKKYDFFTEEYYAYSANTIQSVSVSKHITKDSESQTLTETPLDHTTLRGLFKLDANNNLYADGDIYNADGSGSVKYDEVDLGSLDWKEEYTGSTNKALSSVLSDYRYTENVPFISAKYVYFGTIQSKSNLISPDSLPIGIRLYYNPISTAKKIYVVCPLNETPSGNAVYELATPTTETATFTPFNPLSDIEQGGTEEFIDYGVQQSTRDVAIPCGTDTDFYQGLSLPTVPTTDGTYVLKATVSSGTATLSWVAE